LILVIIETPAGRRNKFAFDPDQAIFALKKVLPAGMVFPYDFGFVPQALAPDGDPIDVLLLMDEPAFRAARSRPVSLVSMKGGAHRKGKDTERRARGNGGSEPHLCQYPPAEGSPAQVDGVNSRTSS
jgi:inorganic pyrophosphatase